MRNVRNRAVGTATIVAMLIGAYRLGALSRSQPAAQPVSATHGVSEELREGRGLTFQGDVAVDRGDQAREGRLREGPRARARCAPEIRKTEAAGSRLAMRMEK